MRPLEILAALDQYLEMRALRFEGVVIGGAALNLLGVVSRPTKDCDILSPTIPEPIAGAARTFAAEMRHGGQLLQDDWFNNGPASLAKELPERWEDRLLSAFKGKALHLRTLGRDDLLRTKLFALCDRALELAALLPWVEEQDLNPDWPAHVRATLADLGRRLGHVV